MELIAKTQSERLIGPIAVSAEYDPASDLRESHTDCAGVQFRVLHTNGLVLIDVRSEVADCITTSLSFDSYIVAMVFHLDGDVRIITDDNGYENPMRLRNKEHNAELINGDRLDIRYEPGRMINSFIVLLSREFCLRILPQGPGKHNRVLNAINMGKRDKLSAGYMNLSQDMKRIIDDVRNCSRKGSFQRLCLEIKIAELLLLQFEQQQLQHAEQVERPLLHDADLERISEAKNILTDNYIHPPTIKDLALLIGMNETKLKAGFKNIYNSTIHAYTHRLRMQKAYQLLAKQHLLLKEVALQVGYRKPANFTAAFNVFFGIHPQKINHAKDVNI